MFSAGHSPSAEDKDQKALSSVLRKLDQLRKLALHSEFTIPLEVLSRVSSPFFPNLEAVELHGKLNLPKDMGDTKLCLPNLRHLSMEERKVPLEFFNKLAADLSFLENLELDSDAYDGLHLVFPPGGFQSLKKLSVNLGKLKNVQIGRLALTRLEDLQISYYPDKPEVKVEIHGKDKVVNKIKRGNKELSKKIKHIPDSSGQSSEQGQRSSLCYTPISENLM
jgi:hypothetical protein